MDTIKGLKRTNYCGQLRASDEGKEVVLFGWAAKQRDLGGLVFIDLRDRTGIIQLSFGEHTNPEAFKKAQSVRSEFVLAAKGVVKERESKNSEIPTGDIEIDVSELRILSKAETTPFEISKVDEVGDDIALKYRYLALRNEKLTQNIITRHKIAKIAREYFYDNDFVEIETPMLIKSTPEGARDYVVPSRVHEGKFYALPQSPQIYKQLLMIAGFDRYVQLARCFRDEDLRADRQPEFTQIDLEMSFVDTDDIMEIAEGFIKKLMRKTVGIDIPGQFDRMTYTDAINKYGSDKPDTRFGMLINDITNIAGDIPFPVFESAIKSGGKVKAIVAKNSAEYYSRKKIDKLTDFVKGIGAKGLAYIRWNEDAPNASFKKFASDENIKALLKSLDAERGDTVFIISGKDSMVSSTLGALRLKIADETGLIPEGKWNYLWITEMPFFEYDEESGQWLAMHHPFTMPMEESIPYLDSDKSRVKAKAFDLVLNGIELSSGSMRITDPALQNKMFEMLGMSNEEIEKKFGFLVDAYKYAAPPHGGMGIGLDRLAMLICGAKSLRDVTAFPKVQNASELMSGAPSEIEQIQLDELSIDLKKSENKDE